MNLFWASFLRRAAQRSNRGRVRQFDGVETAWVNSLMPINNASFLAAPVTSEPALRNRLAAAIQDASPHQLPWAFFLYEPFTASLEPERVISIAAESGLARAMEVRVMTGEADALTPPRRPLPPLSFKRVESPADVAHVLDINLRAYGMPLEITPTLIETEAYFSEIEKEYGFLAYDGDEAVSTATVVELDGWLYVALVATEPAQRSKGYAEAVMRHALAESASALGITRTALDATAMGEPIYQRMGYSATGEVWSMYVSA